MSTSAQLELTAAQRNEMRVSLEAAGRQADEQIVALTANVDAIVEAAELVGTDDEHDPEGTTIAFERAQATALLNQARADRHAVDAALRRLDEGTFGTCETCGQSIGKPRLEAIPAASKCINCA